MHLRSRPAHGRLWSIVITLVLALALAACGGGDNTEPADQAADEQPAEEQDDGQPSEEEPAEGDDGQQAASDDCAVDAETVSSIVGSELVFAETFSQADGGLTCIFETTDEDSVLSVSVGVGTWDGSEEEVDRFLSTTTEYLGEVMATPDLGDRAFLWNEDDVFYYTLMVFAGDSTYSTQISGVDASAEERREMLVSLYEQATG